MKIPNTRGAEEAGRVSLARIVSEDSQLSMRAMGADGKSSKDS